MRRSQAEGAFGIRQFRRFLPVCIIQDAVNAATGMISIAQVGNFLGEEAMAGVALAMPVLLMAQFAAYMIGGGMMTNYLLRRGRLDEDGAQKVFSQSVWLALVLGAALAALVAGGRELFLSFIAPSAAVAGHAREYWRMLPYFALMMPIAVLFAFCALCDGAGKLVGVASLIRLAVAAIMPFILLRRGWGADAGAIGLVASIAVFGLVLSVHFLRKNSTFRLRAELHPRTWIKIIRTSFGDASATLGDAIVAFLLGKTVSVALGPEALVLVPIALLVMQLSDVSSGIAEGMQPVITVYAGERNTRAIRGLVGHAGKVIAAYSAIVMGVLLIFPEVALAFLGIRDESLVETARAVVRWSVLAIYPLVLSNFLNNYYQCVEHEGVSLLTSTIGWFVAPIAAIVVFGMAGERYFWMWLPVAKWGGLFVVSGWVYFRYGRAYFPWLIDRRRDRRIRGYALRLEPHAIVEVSKQVARRVKAIAGRTRAMRAALLVEDALMIVVERNAGKRVFAEVTLDWNERVRLTLRDDGTIFDITDEDAQVSGLRAYLVASMMRRHQEKHNLLTTGFNRNVFEI